MFEMPGVEGTPHTAMFLYPLCPLSNASIHSSPPTPLLLVYNLTTVRKARDGGV